MVPGMTKILAISFSYSTYTHGKNLQFIQNKLKGTRKTGANGFFSYKRLICSLSITTICDFFMKNLCG